MILSLTEAGMEAVGDRRTAQAEQLAEALADGFTAVELELLMAAAPFDRAAGVVPVISDGVDNKGGAG
jgi:hypothetical protein